MSTYLNRFWVLDHSRLRKIFSHNVHIGRLLCTYQYMRANQICLFYNKSTKRLISDSITNVINSVNLCIKRRDYYMKNRSLISAPTDKLIHFEISAKSSDNNILHQQLDVWKP